MTERTTRALESATPSPVKCRRYPCDTAYRRGTHQPTALGEVWHTVRWGTEHTPAGALAWQVAAGAWGDDGPWMLVITMPERTRGFRAVGDGYESQEAWRFHEDIAKALSCIARANAVDSAELRRQLAEEEELVRELQAEKDGAR